MNVTSIFKAATGFLGGIQTYLIVGAVSGALAFGGGIWLETKISRGEINALKLADAKTKTDAVQHQADEDARIAKVDLKFAVDAQKAFDDLHIHYVFINKEVLSYVTPIQEARTCITVGLARSLRQYADDPGQKAPELATGQSNDDCSDVTAAEVADWFKAYAEASRHNSLQLTLLQAEIRAKQEAQKGSQ